MADKQSNIETIRTGVLGRDVREAIADTAEQVYAASEAATQRVDDLDNLIIKAETTVIETMEDAKTTIKETADAVETAIKNTADTAEAAIKEAADAAAVSENNAAASAATAESHATQSESWAVGGTGARAGEDTNNAKYWAEQAEIAVGGGVISFNGRSGAVQPQAGDYSADMINAGVLAPGQGGLGMAVPASGTYIRSDGDIYTGVSADAVRTDIGAAAESHVHNAADITAGLLPASRGGTGITAPTANYYLRSTGSGYAGRSAAQVLSDIAAQGTADKGRANGYAGLDSTGFLDVKNTYATPISALYYLTSSIPGTGNDPKPIYFPGKLQYDHKDFKIAQHDGNGFYISATTATTFHIWISAAAVVVPNSGSGIKSILVFNGSTYLASAEYRAISTDNRMSLSIPEVYLGTVTANSGYFGVAQQWIRPGDVLGLGSSSGAGASFVSIKAIKAS